MEFLFFLLIILLLKGPLFKSIKVGTIFIADEFNLFNLADDYILLSTLTAIEAMEDEKIIYIPNEN